MKMIRIATGHRYLTEILSQVRWTLFCTLIESRKLSISPNPPYKDRNQQPANDQQIIAGDDVHGVQEAWNQNGAAAR